MLSCQFDKIGGFTRAFLAEDKVQFIGVEVFSGREMPHKDEAEKGNDKWDKRLHIITSLESAQSKEGPAPGQGVGAGRFFRRG